MVSSMPKHYLTVSDLVKTLQSLPQDLPIVYASDDEWNSVNEVNSLPQIIRIKTLQFRNNYWFSDGQEYKKGYKNGIDVVIIN